MRVAALGTEDREFIRRAVLLALDTRFWFLAIIAFVWLSSGGLGDFTDFALRSVNYWDAQMYLRIAETGYLSGAHHLADIAMMPGFPAAVALVRVIVGNAVVAGLAVSLAGSLAAAFFLQKLVSLDYGSAAAKFSAFFLFLFPTAYFLAIPYSEAMFIALALASFYYARRENWLASGVAGMFACATRAAGLALIPALLIEALAPDLRFDAKRFGAERLKKRMWLALLPVGFVVYLAVNWAIAGSPTAFVSVQAAQFFHHPVAMWDSLANAAREVLLHPLSLNLENENMARLSSFVFAAILLLASLKWLRPSYQVYAWLNVVALFSLSWQISMPRYLLSVFPLFIILGRMGARHPLRAAVVLTLFLELQALLFWFSARGWWAF